MKTYARIENGVVAELFKTDGDIAALFHPSLIWAAVDSSVAVGDAATQSGSAWAFAKPAAPAVPVPDSVTPLQARKALLAAGLLDKVTAAVAAADQGTQLDWEFATVINRTSPTVATLAAALSLTSAQLDALFTAAAAIMS